ncbi:MAG: YlxR family protein [Desulfovibrio sp.]|nr:YlxR family protein [Desulfovibrio sp.]
MANSEKSPVRMCLICRKRYPKKYLNRYTMDENGALIPDESGKRQARGAYVCSDEDCARRFSRRENRKKRQVR